MRAEELLKKHIHSGLESLERFELEKLALDDDFLADAWEGIQLADTKEVQEAIARLYNRLSSQKSAKILPLYRRIWPYAVAASFTLIAAVTFFIPQAKKIDPMLAELTELEDELNSSEAVAIQIVEEDLQSAISDEPVREITNSTSSIGANTKTQETQFDNEEKRDKSPQALTRSNPLPKAIQTPVVIQKPESRVAMSSEEMKEEVQEMPTPDLVDESLYNSKRAKSSKADHIAFTEITSATGMAKKTIDADSDEPSATLNQSISDGDLKSTESSTILAKKERTRSVPTHQSEPIVGFVEYEKIMKENTTIMKETLFMIGLFDEIVDVSFNVGTDGNPFNIVIHEKYGTGSIGEKIKSLLRTSGRWTATDDRVDYSFPLPVKR